MDFNTAESQEARGLQRWGGRRGDSWYASGLNHKITSTFLQIKHHGPTKEAKSNKHHAWKVEKAEICSALMPDATLRRIPERRAHLQNIALLFTGRTKLFEFSQAEHKKAI